jgi:hypothetical protein
VQRLPVPLRALLERLFDDAGLFPPARLPMAEALRAHEAATTGPHGRMVASFVCPAGRLPELDALVAAGLPRPAALGVAGYDGPGAWRGVYAARGLVQVEAAHGVRVPPPPGRVLRYVEVAPHLPLAPILDAVQSAGARVAVRCDGLTPDTVPSCDWLAGVLAGAVDRGQVVKASGLDRPFREVAPDRARHGFVNLLAAAAAARARRPAAEVSDLLAAPEGRYAELATYLSGPSRELLASVGTSSIAAAAGALDARGLL